MNLFSSGNFLKFELLELTKVKKSFRKLKKVGHIIRKWYSSSIKLGELQILHILRSGGVDFFPYLPLSVPKSWELNLNLRSDFLKFAFSIVSRYGSNLISDLNFRYVLNFFLDHNYLFFQTSCGYSFL